MFPFQSQLIIQDTNLQRRTAAPTKSTITTTITYQFLFNGLTVQTSLHVGATELPHCVSKNVTLVFFYIFRKY